MQLALAAAAFISIVFVAIFILKTKGRGQRRAITGLIFLSTSSVAMALALNSMYSLVFFASHIILLILALTLAIREQREQRKKV